VLPRVEGVIFVGSVKTGTLLGKEMSRGGGGGKKRKDLYRQGGKGGGTFPSETKRAVLKKNWGALKEGEVRIIDALEHGDARRHFRIKNNVHKWSGIRIGGGL